MAWTSPKTWSSEPLTSSDLNTYVRDNQDHLKDRLDNSANVIVTGNTTLSTRSETFVDIESDKFSVSLLTHGGDVLVGFTGTVKSTAIARPVHFNLAVDGSLYFADDGITQSVIGADGFRNQSVPLCLVVLITDLDAGAHTFKLRWKTHRSNTASMEISSLHPQFWAKEM
ncbi:MAG: hypothetical protein OXE95_07205 [Chloroflexi bacterium]|nr:hypothetical protein [Chloroflexota bacterium]MCY4247343.1 hypothetical protein [Chloroflexota bacterium]